MTKLFLKENPRFSFDYSYLEKFEKPSFWFFEILTNLELKQYLYDQISDPDDMEHINSVLSKYFRENNEIEGVEGTYDRV